MTGNNPKPGLVSVDVYTKFGKILSIHSQDIEWKPNIHGFTESRIHRITDSRKDGMTEGQGESSIAPLFQSGAIKKLVLDTPSSGVDAKVKRGVKQELALPSKQNLLVSCQDCQKALMTV